MNTEQNPYEPPRAAPAPTSQAAADKRAYQSDGCLVLPHNGVAPARCIKCHAQHDLQQVERLMRWYNPLINLLFLLNALILIVVALIFRKSAHVTYSVCRRCLARSQRAKRITVSLVMLGIAMIIGGPLLSSAAEDWMLVLLVVGFLVLLVAVLVGSLTRFPLTKRIDAQWVMIGRVNPQLVAELPKFPGRMG